MFSIFLYMRHSDECYCTITEKWAEFDVCLFMVEDKCYLFSQHYFLLLQILMPHDLYIGFYVF